MAQVILAQGDRSTMFSHDAEVGVKCMLNRGCETLAALTPSCSARVRVLQWVAASGLLCVVNSTTRATSTLTGGAPRGRSRSMPSRPDSR